MRDAGYVPDRGDLDWLSFDPQAGHERAGRRPAIVLSPKAYNARTGLALACPITRQVEGYPFEVELPADGSVQGVALADQVRCVDWRARLAERAGRAKAGVVAEALARLAPLLGPG